jgi:hypothetical protein
MIAKNDWRGSRTRRSAEFMWERQNLAEEARRNFRR